MYWWMQEIVELRRTCLHNKRKYSPPRRNSEALTEAEEFKRSYKSLKEVIIKGKKVKWEEFCNDLSNIHWGLRYKIVTEKLSATSTVLRLNRSTIDNIVQKLFHLTTR